MEETVTERATVRVLTAADVIADITRLVVELKALTGAANLTDIVYDSLDYRLSVTAAAKFDDLDSLAWMAGATRLPCCSSHDEEDIDTWVAQVDSILTTGALPKTEAQAGSVGG